MRRRGFFRYTKALLFTLCFALGGSGTAFAVTSSSNSYKVSETQFGGGSTVKSCSEQYCAKVSIGNMSGAAGESNVGDAKFSTLTDDNPRLEMILETGSSSLGDLTTENTATKTVVLKISNYLAGGYQLQIIGDPPKFSGHTLTRLATQTGSIPGVEQFGMNVVANNSLGVGANPVQVPSGAATFGEVDDNYNDPNQFKYASEDVIARSNAKSGRTDYTITMVINIAGDTPAGKYSSDFAAVLIPAF